MDVTLPAPAALAGLAAVLLALVALGVLVVRARRGARAEVAAARAETVRLAEQMAALGEQVARLQAPPPARDAAYVITDAGARPHAQQHDHDADPRPMVRDTLVLNAALGEPLVKAAAFTHGVRRALGPQSRARIRVAVRQETRRVRKERRREMRQVWLAHKRAARAVRTDEVETARTTRAA